MQFFHHINFVHLLSFYFIFLRVFWKIWSRREITFSHGSNICFIREFSLLRILNMQIIATFTTAVTNKDFPNKDFPDNDLPNKDFPVFLFTD